MDVVEASHFERLKGFIVDRPWWEMKLTRTAGYWQLFLINTNDFGPFSVMPFIHHSLGEALKLASVWVGEQYAIQERETKEVSLDESPGDSKTLDEGIRELPDDWEEQHITRG